MKCGSMRLVYNDLANSKGMKWRQRYECWEHMVIRLWITMQMLMLSICKLQCFICFLILSVLLFYFWRNHNCYDFYIVRHLPNIVVYFWKYHVTLLLKFGRIDKWNWILWHKTYCFIHKKILLDRLRHQYDVGLDPVLEYDLRWYPWNSYS